MDVKYIIGKYDSGVFTAAACKLQYVQYFDSFLSFSFIGLVSRDMHYLKRFQLAGLH